MQVEALTVPLHPHHPIAQLAEPPNRLLVQVAVRVEAMGLEMVPLHPHHPTAQLAELPNHLLALAVKPEWVQEPVEEPGRAPGLGLAPELEHQTAPPGEPPGRL